MSRKPDGPRGPAGDGASVDSRPDRRQSYPGPSPYVKNLPHNPTRPKSANLSPRLRENVLRVLAAFGEMSTGNLVDHAHMRHLGKARRDLALAELVHEGVVTVETRPGPAYPPRPVRYYRLAAGGGGR